MKHLWNQWLLGTQRVHELYEWAARAANEKTPRRTGFFYGEGISGEGIRCGASKNNSTVQISDVERASGDESVGAKEDKRLDTPCRIHFHHRTNRLADSDGRSVKAIIDSLILAGILRNDDPRFVKEVTQSQEVVKGDESTVVDIYWEEK